MCSIQLPYLHNLVFHTFTGVYSRSAKEPDLFIRPRSMRYPSIVSESGWSQSFPHLRADKDLLIHGFGGHVRLVILIKWTKLNGGRVSGVAEAWAGDDGANDRLIQTEVIANLSSILFKNSATDNYRRSFPHPPPKLLLPRKFMSPDLNYMGVRYLQEETPMTF